MEGASLKVARPMTLEELEQQTPPSADDIVTLPLADDIVVFDELGSGLGSLIAISEGGEAMQPFRPEMKPIDAYAAAILDSLDVK